jgi:hypothetical protein
MFLQAIDITKTTGQQELLKLLGALRADRFETCARLTSDKFSFTKTQERQAAFSDLLKTWKDNFDTGTTGRERLSLPAVPAAPGTGKTRFAWLAVARGRLPGVDGEDAEWRNAMNELDDIAFKTCIQNAVGVAVTFNCDTNVVVGEEVPRYMIGVRMLYGHFCGINIMRFEHFIDLLKRHDCYQVDTIAALEMIEQDAKMHHTLDGGAKRHVILVVDEPLRAVTTNKPGGRRDELGALTTSVGQLITNFEHVHVLMTSLSGIDLVEASQTVSGRTVHFIQHFGTLSKASVECLVRNEPCATTKAKLNDRRFKVVLRECLGVPRLLEKVFKVAGEAHIDAHSACDTIRTMVAIHFESGMKYRNRMLRFDALLAALSGPWRPASDARQQKTRAAEREGYLFDGKIPPLLLKWWWSMDDECGQADEMHALLQAANGIYILSDEVSGAEHGPRFERQLAHLWRILTITDAVSRRECDEVRPRTIHGILGKAQLNRSSRAVSPRADDTATFNRVLKDIDAVQLSRPSEELDKPAASHTDVPADLVHGIPYFPKDKQNPGFDFVVVEPAAGGGGVQVLVEAKFSAEEATTSPLSQAAIVEKYVKAIRGRPTVREHLLAGRLCYLIGGLRKVQEGVMRDIDTVVSAIVDALRKGDVVQHDGLLQLVRGSLVLLTRGHTEALLTSTLSSLPPFGERW